MRIGTELSTTIQLLKIKKPFFTGYALIICGLALPSSSVPFNSRSQQSDSIKEICCQANCGLDIIVAASCLCGVHPSLRPLLRLHPPHSWPSQGTEMEGHLGPHYSQTINIIYRRNQIQSTHFEASSNWVDRNCCEMPPSVVFLKRRLSKTSIIRLL